MRCSGGRRSKNIVDRRGPGKGRSLAGVWANHTDRGSNIVLEYGDIEEALNATSAIGDDRLQQQSQGRVASDSFTHGSSAQRVRWFRIGFSTGNPDSCDTFSSKNP